MAHAILAYGNQIDGALLSGGGWLDRLPLANLRDRRIGKIARSISPAEVHTTFDVDFTGTRLLRLFALVGHNLTTAARYRLLYSTVADFSSLVLDSGWLDVWPVVYPFGTLPWGAPTWWGGTYAPAQLAGSNASIRHILPSSSNARYVRVMISDEENPAGYVQLGRPFAADGWQPVRNMVYGAGMGWEDPSLVQEAMNGTEYFDERTKRRIARFEFPGMTEDEAMAQAFEIQRACGITKEVFYIWDPEDTVHAVRRQMLARLRTLSIIENPGPNRWKAPFELRELI